MKWQMSTRTGWRSFSSFTFSIVFLTMVGYNSMKDYTGRHPCTSMEPQSRVGLTVLCGNTTCPCSLTVTCNASFWGFAFTVKKACDPRSLGGSTPNGTSPSMASRTPTLRSQCTSRSKVYFLWKGKQHLPSPIAIHLVLVLRGGACQFPKDS